MADFKRIYAFLEERDPFRESYELVNIVTGVEAGEHVTAHKALSVGNCILNSMVDRDIKKFKFSRKMAVVNMAAVVVKGKTKSYTVDPNFLFQRLLSSIILRRTEIDIEAVFSHELCTFPPRLFAAEELLLSAETKSQLTKTFPAIERLEETNMTMKFVVDGGMLIHRIPWKVGSTYESICANYAAFLSHYPGCTIVFDGYEHSTKDMTHRIRSKNTNCSNITPELTTTLTVKKPQFLSNTGNKERFIKLLSDYLVQLGYTCVHAQADADVLICRTAVDYLNSGQNITVQGDDTDLLVILIHMTKDMPLTSQKIYLSTKSTIYDIQSVRSHLGVKGTSSILLLHSFSGCDTVSRIYGIGKSKLLNLRQKLSDTVVRTFYRSDSTKDQIKISGEKIFCLLLNLPSGEGLDAARLRLFNSKLVKGNAALDSTSLPPTSAAAYQHSLRAYHQIQSWCENFVDPVGWGWKQKEDFYLPVTSDLPAAPAEIMEILYCNCKTGCKQQQCSCVKHGIRCGPGCTNCIENCENRELSDD